MSVAPPYLPSSPSSERVSLERLAWVSACLLLALLPQCTTLPIWVTATVLAVAALRLILAARGRDAPPRAIRLGISVCAIALLFVQFRTFNGLTAGGTLLSLIAGLKLLETRTRRDIYVVTMIIYFLSLTALLQGESFWLLSYLIGVCWLTTSTLLRLTSSAQVGRWQASARYAGRLLLQALPLAAAFWLFFPRFGGPLWQLPDSGGGATSGLSDSMSPGDLTELAMSDEIAFRVRFTGPSPPPEARYWRGPVLHDFDGHAWHRTAWGLGRAAPLSFDGPAYRYTVSLEPNQRNWLFLLDWPSEWNASRAFLTGDYMLVQPEAVSQPLDVTATSYIHAHASEPLSKDLRRRDTRLPSGGNPRAAKLAQDLREAHPDDLDYVHAVLDLFRNQPFFYTLTPPRLGQDSVDGFLFDTRRGFCGHYASAFATLMRAVGIPARVVTGYQGGTYNRFADYWIVRQSDAHAWDEIWIEGNGWLRIDPTTMVSAERVDHGLNDTTSAGVLLTSRWQQRTPWLIDVRLRLDALRLLWRERILTFNSDSQMKLLGWLHVPDPDGQKLAIVLAVCLITGMGWLTWQVRRELHTRTRPKDAATRAYERLCHRLANVGLVRMPHEGAEDFAARVATQRPDLGPSIVALSARYSALRYAAGAARGSVAEFIDGVRGFKPGRRAGPNVHPR